MRELYELLFCPIHGILPKLLAVVDAGTLGLVVRMSCNKFLSAIGRSL